MTTEKWPKKPTLKNIHQRINKLELRLKNNSASEWIKGELAALYWVTGKAQTMVECQTLVENPPNKRLQPTGVPSPAKQSPQRGRG